MTSTHSKEKINKLLTHWVTNVLLLVLTFWALFADDIRLVATTKESDTLISVTILLVQVIFVIEIVLSSIYIEGYFLNFYFWLDVLSIISLILNIHWFYEKIIEIASGATRSINNKQQITKVGSRIVKVLRIVRLVRIVRVTKIYKISQTINSRKNDLNNKIKGETKVGQKLNDLMLKRVIILILAMIFGVIMFNPNFYYQGVTSMEFGIKMFNDYNDTNDPSLKLLFDSYVNYYKNLTSPIIYADISNLRFGNISDTERLRQDELITVSDECTNLLKDNYNDSLKCYAAFDNRVEAKLNALLNIGVTLFICLVMVIGALCFGRDADYLVLKPISSMVEKLSKITNNPHQAHTELFHDDANTTAKKKRCCFNETEDKIKFIETNILDKTIVKIGSLLALSFDEDSSRILEKSLNSSNSKGNLDLTQDGELFYGIVAHFGIDNIPLLNEALKESITIVLNEIFEIVNLTMIDHCVDITKLTGNGILFIWKIDPEYIENDQIKDSYEVNQLVDFVIISVLKSLIKLKRSLSLDEIRRRTNTTHIKELDSFSFGISMGWIITSILGSSLKIDINYFSPCVSLARILEESAASYRVNIVLSEMIYNFMSERSKQTTRPIDSIVRERSAEIICERIFTVDFNLGNFEDDCKIDDKLIRLEEKLNRYNKNERRRLKKEILRLILKNSQSIWEDFENDDDYSMMRCKYLNEEFNYKYHLGFSYYLKGDWKKARKLLNEANALCSDEDGPCMFLFDYINKEHEGKWVGGRFLLS